MSLRDELDVIYRQHGRLTPRLVLDEARDEQHPLHSRFEWDDSVAAEKYRLSQAQELIVSLKVSYRDGRGRAQEVRAFHALSSPEGGFEYKPVEEIARDPVATAVLLAEMERDWKQLRARWSHFGEFAEMIRRDLDEQAS